ncbi:MAG: T9SS type A sorting domain-containing protein [Bacteroidales bacterium]|nr:T9SS type A sorting domain-containing protein [Bacteroidales bacterium]
MKKICFLIIGMILLATSFNLQAQTPGENIDVTHYEINLWDIDFTNHTLQGETFINFTATAPTNTLVLELKTLTVTDVACDYYYVESFNHEGNYLTVTFDETLAAGASAILDIRYGGSTFNESWGGIMWTTGYVCNMGVGFESIPHNLGKCWFPCVDNFTDKATYNLNITVPNSTEAICGGNFINTYDNGDGTTTWQWEIPQEVATYHVSFAVGDYVEWTDTYNGIERDIPITVYVKPNQINNVPGTFVHVKDIAAFYENCFGPYPFNRIGYVVTSVGCMEHVDNIGITSGIVTGNTTQEEYVAHELSHMYFGNKTTCATAEDMWLNEGFAQFCGVFYRSDVYGEDDFQQAMSTKINNISSWCKSESNWIPLNNIPQSMTYDGSAVYNRGAVVVNTLMNYLGRETFLEGLRHHLQNHAYGAASSEQLRDALTEATGIDMNGFFDTYVFTAGMPHFGVDLVNVTPSGSQYDVTVRMTYQHYGPSHVGQNNRVEVTFINNDGQMQTAMVHWDGLEANQTVTLNIDPVVAFVDYNNQMLDAKLDKNLTATAPTTFSAGQQLSITVNSVTDSVMLRGEEHYIAPENDPNIPGLTLSTKHYWNVSRLDLGQADVSGKFTYSNNNTMDGDIIQTENDSAVLLYRANYNQPWHSIPYTRQGNWKLGFFTVNDLPTGQYTLGVIDKSTLSLTEQYADQKLFPNPANDQVTLQWNGNSSGEIKVYNQNLQLLKSIPFDNTDRITINISDLASGLYFIECNAMLHKLIIK